MPVSEAGLLRATPGITWLQDHLGTDRIMRVSRTEQEAAADATRLFLPNLGLLFDIHDAQGWREQVPRWYPRLWEGVSAITRKEGVSGVPASRADSPILDIARVRYLVAARSIPELESRRVFPEASPPPADHRDLWIYENPGCLPRAFVVHRARCLPDGEARSLLREGGIDLSQEVILSHWPGDNARTEYPAAEGVDLVTFAAEDPGHLIMTVETRGQGYLVVNDTFMPGWCAKVTDAGGRTRDVPIVRAMTTFMAVPIGMGKQRIELHYMPPAITRGVVLTGLGWIAFLLLPLMHTPKSQVRRPSRVVEEGDGF
jgi:hypothetical protein